MNSTQTASSVLQDTSRSLVQHGQKDILRLKIPVDRDRIDLDRALEVLEQSEQREQQIATERDVVVKPRKETIGKPSIEVDSLMAKYTYIGCSPHIDFPDTLVLTILERYYQPITLTYVFESSIADTTTYSFLPDSLPTDTLSVVSVTNIPQMDSFFSGESRTSGYPSIITIFLMCSLILIAWIKLNFGKSLSQMIRSYFNYQQACRIFEERRESDRQAAFLSNIFYFINVGIFITLSLPFFDIDRLWGSYGLSVIFFALACCIIYAIKSGIWKMLGNIFLVQSFSGEYVYNMYLYNRNTGFFIFPFIATIPFVSYVMTPYMIYGVIIIFCLSYLLRIGRIFQIIHAQNVSVFYFILYLCTLEILPLLLFIKICKMLNDGFFS